MITNEQEDLIANILSNLTPIEYSLLMKKVDRRKWEYSSKWQILAQHTRDLFKQTQSNNNGQKI